MKEYKPTNEQHARDLINALNNETKAWKEAQALALRVKDLQDERTKVISVLQLWLDMTETLPNRRDKDMLLKILSSIIDVYNPPKR